MWINKNTKQIYTSHDEIRSVFQEFSLPEILSDDTLTALDIAEVHIEPFTESYNQLTEKLVLGEVVEADGLFSVGYIVAPKYPTEKEQEEELIKYFVDKTQTRLDDFAKQRGYDGILSACTYATSKIQKFQEEGQKCVDMRDSTWAALYDVLEKVKNKEIETPSSYDDIVQFLPELIW